VWELYPGVAHARIMIQGFLTAFVVGFLGTALPRLLDVPRITLGETLGFAVAIVGTAVLQAAGLEFWGNQLFLVTLCALLFLLGVRSVVRKDTPPPGFVLVLLGLAGAIAGTCILVLGHAAPAVVPLPVGVFGRLLLNQGFLLLPVMGIGAFLLPRFFGLPNRQSFPESLALPPGWLRLAGFAAACGLAVLASFALEARGATRPAFGLRALAVAGYFAREVPFFRSGFGGGTLALGLRVALLAFPVGYGLMAVWPGRASSLLHVVFLTGFSLITLVVASRVILGHSGQSEKFRARLGPVLAMIGLIVLAMATRVSADWLPAIRMTHYAYAALVWIAGVVVWGAAILPGVRRPDAGE